MINIPMKSTGAYDQNTISSINTSVTHGAVSARDAESINRWKTQENAASSASGQRVTPQAPVPAASRPAPTPSASTTAPRPAATPAASRPAPTPSASTTAPRPAAAPAAPAQKPLPPLMKPIQKGQKVPIETGGALTALKACFGWNSTNAQCDVDVSAFMLGADGRVLGDDWFVFYGQMTSPDYSTQFQVDNSADREIIHINLQKLNPAVKKIVFVLTINEAFEKNLHFGMMKDAYVRILNPQNNSELVSFRMTDYYSNVISMMIGEIYQHNGAWKFNAVGNGVAKDLLGLCNLYGVQVID